GHARAKGGVPALVLPPSAPRGARRTRSHRRPARPAQEPAAPAGALAPRGRAAVERAERRRAAKLARPGAAGGSVCVRPARVGGDRLAGLRCGSAGGDAACARQGIEGAAGADRAAGRGGVTRLLRPRPPRAGRGATAERAVRQPPRRPADAPRALQDRARSCPPRRTGEADEPAQAAPLLRYPPAGRALL